MIDAQAHYEQIIDPGFALKTSEVRQISIQTVFPESYDYSWVKGRIIAKMVCSDGLTLWIYLE